MSEGVWMAGKVYHVPADVYRILPLIYIGAGLLALFNAANLVGTVSSLLLIGAGVLTFIWRCRATAGRRRGRSTPKPRAGRLRPEYDYPDATNPCAEVAQHSTPPAHKAGRAALFRSSRLNRRRGIQDRRGWEPMPDAPFRDSEGAFIKRDRRRLPERRRNSIEVREVSKRKRSDPL